MGLEVCKLTPSLGAELRGVDIARLDAVGFAEVRDLWVEHGVLLFRGLELSEKDQVAFSRLFGELEIHVRAEYLSPDNLELLLVSNLRKADGAHPSLFRPQIPLHLAGHDDRDRRPAAIRKPGDSGGAVRHLRLAGIRLQQ